jgi:hypothetical protein
MDRGSHCSPCCRYWGDGSRRLFVGKWPYDQTCRHDLRFVLQPLRSSKLLFMQRPHDLERQEKGGPGVDHRWSVRLHFGFSLVIVTGPIFDGRKSARFLAGFLNALDERRQWRNIRTRNLTAGIRLTAAIAVCMFSCLPARAQEMALPTERAATRSASPVAAASAVLDMTQAANWAYRNGSVLSMAAAGTARQDNATPQAEPSPQSAPARPRLHPKVKRRKPWTKVRIVVLGAGLGMTGAGAYLWATGPMVHNSPADCALTNTCNPTLYWSGKKKEGLGLTMVGASVSLFALAWPL